MTRFDTTLPNEHPVTGERVTGWALPGDALTRANVRRDAERLGSAPTVMGLGLPSGHVSDDDEADAVAAAFGYAWQVNADPNRTGDFDDRARVWSVDWTCLLADVDMGARRNVHRSTPEAFADFVCATVKYLTEGSPERRDGTRLFPPPLTLPLRDVTIYLAR